MSLILEKNKVSQKPVVHEKMKNANKTRNQCGLTAPYSIKLCNVCMTQKQIFSSEVNVLLNVCVP